MSIYARVYKNNIVKELTSNLEDFLSKEELLIEEAEGETKLLESEKHQQITKKDLEGPHEYFREFPLTREQAKKVNKKLKEGKLVLLTPIKDEFDKHRYLYIMHYDTIIKDKSPGTLI